MAGSNFQIPGLGMPIGDNPYPAENFAPDVLAAAASKCEDEELGEGGTDGMQWERAQKERREGKVTPDKQDASAAADMAKIEATDDSGVEPKEEERMDVDTDAKEGRIKAHHQDEVEMNLDERPDSVASAKDDHGSRQGSTPAVTDALEAALDGLLSATNGEVYASENNVEPARDEEGEHPEWEEDSSPYESSSESSSSDSLSDDDDSEGEGAYPLLGIEETAKLLLASEEDGEDGEKKDVAARGHIRTKNEMPEPPLPKPDVAITAEMKIELLGYVASIVENTLVIKSKAPGEVQVLDAGSVLCKEDRTVIGALGETLGSVKNPVYAVAFSSEEEIRDLGLEAGASVYYSVQHANYVFTQVLKATKGSDASNLHDEEVGADEMEFSDDEKEAEYKRQLKAKKRGGKAGRGGREREPHSHPLRSELSPTVAKAPDGLSYDEEDDGPYKPLTRPPGFAQGLPESLPAPPPQAFNHGSGGYGRGGPSRGGRRGDSRGGRHQGHRGGRGDRRGAGHGARGGFNHDRVNSQASDGFSPASLSPQRTLPPGPFGSTPTPPSGAQLWPAGLPPFPPPPIPFGNSQAQNTAPAIPNFSFNFQGWNATHTQAPIQPYHHQRIHQQPATNGYPQVSAPQSWPQAVPQAGAYNPAFFPGLQAATSPPPPPQQVQQPGGQGRYNQQGLRPPYWGQQHGNAYGQQ